jgi:hypothetical protein
MAVVTSRDHLQLLNMGTIAVYMLSRLPQISLNYRTQSTGVLSVYSFAGNFVGSTIRLGTAYRHRDALMLLNMLASLGLNGTLVAQILLYKGGKQ